MRSFDEFLEKFEPVVYSFFDANNQKVLYTLKKPESISDVLPINLTGIYFSAIVDVAENETGIICDLIGTDDGSFLPLCVVAAHGIDDIAVLRFPSGYLFGFCYLLSSDAVNSDGFVRRKREVHSVERHIESESAHVIALEVGNFKIVSFGDTVAQVDEVVGRWLVVHSVGRRSVLE